MTEENKEIVETTITASFTGKISTAQFENSSPFFAITEKYNRKFSNEELVNRHGELHKICVNNFDNCAEVLNQGKIAKQNRSISWYTTKDGLKYPSVTSILNFDKEFFIAPEELQQYASRGTLLHKQAEIYLNTGVWKEPNEITECSFDYLTVKSGSLGLEFEDVDFASFIKDYPIKVISTEKHTINDVHKYGGRIDIIATIESSNKGKWDKVEDVVYDTPIIFDIKTSTSLDKTSGYTQLSAYAISENINHLCLIHLTKENKSGYSKPLIENNIERYFNVFLNKREQFKRRFGV